MAGSYNHCVDDQGRLRSPKRVCSMLECSSGDVYEAVEEMFGMIWLLASRLSEDTDGTTSAAVFVEDARQRYEKGLELSPGVKGPTTSQFVAAQMAALHG